ncbi:hypothetical protein D3C81_1942600 [compost metagenome]
MIEEMYFTFEILALVFFIGKNNARRTDAAESIPFFHNTGANCPASIIRPASEHFSSC